MKQTHMMYGLVTAIVMIVVSTILYVTNLTFKPGMQWIVDVPFLIGIIMNAIAFSKANNTYVTFGNVFGSGFKMSAIVTLITLVWSFISLMIFPEMVSRGLEMAKQSMIEKNNLSEEQIDKAMEMTQKYFKVFMIAGVVFGTMIMGAIFSVIGAAIAKKNGTSQSQVIS